MTSGEYVSKPQLIGYAWFLLAISAPVAVANYAPNLTAFELWLVVGWVLLPGLNRLK